ncbi:hypothetical protein GCM10027596_32980 [Nocardioides korecus]
MVLRWLLALPPPVRPVVVGAVLTGTAGASVGLVVGLSAYAPTAWAAALEVGLPATLLGALLGVAWAVLRPRRGGSRAG